MKLTRTEALEILSLEEGCDEVNIKAAYKRKALQWHPDKNPDAEAKEMFQKVHASYKKLTAVDKMENPYDSDDEDEDDFDFEDDFFDEAAEFFSFFFSQRAGGMSGMGYGGGSQSGVGMGPFAGLPHVHIHLSSHGGYTIRPGGGMGGPAPFYADDDDDYSNASSEDIYTSDEQRLKEMEWYRKRYEQQEARRKENEEHVEKVAKANAAAQKKKAEATARDAAKTFKASRPTVATRDETSITFNLAKGAAEEKRDEVWQLQYRLANANRAWDVVEKNSPTATVTGILPGTRYEFQARRGHEIEGDVVWGQWSVAATYPTLGQPPAAAPPSKLEATGQGRKKGKAAKAQKAQPTPQEEEEDLEAERERLKAEKAKEAALKAALDKAAEEFASESAKLAAMADQAPKQPAAPKKTKTHRAKPKKKNQSNAEDDFWAPYKPPEVKKSLGDMPRVDAPCTRAINFAGASRFAPQDNNYTGPMDAFGAPVNGTSADEDLELQEAIQLSLALEASRDLAKCYGIPVEDEDPPEQFDRFADAFGGIKRQEERAPDMSSFNDHFPAAQPIAKQQQQHQQVSDDDGWGVEEASSWDEPAGANGGGGGWGHSPDSNQSQQSTVGQANAQPVARGHGTPQKPAVEAGDWGTEPDAEPWGQDTSQSASTWERNQPPMPTWDQPAPKPPAAQQRPAQNTGSGWGAQQSPQPNTQQATGAHWESSPNGKASWDHSTTHFGTWGQDATQRSQPAQAGAHWGRGPSQQPQGNGYKPAASREAGGASWDGPSESSGGWDNVADTTTTGTQEYVEGRGWVEAPPKPPGLPLNGQPTQDAGSWGNRDHGREGNGPQQAGLGAGANGRGAYMGGATSRGRGAYNGTVANGRGTYGGRQAQVANTPARGNQPVHQAQQNSVRPVMPPSKVSVPAFRAAPAVPSAQAGPSAPAEAHDLFAELFQRRVGQ